MATHTEKGRTGEEIALKLLREKGYIILERNWRYQHKEVDIIAQDGLELVFIEVKLRTSSTYGTAIQGVDEAKRHNLTIAADHYVRSRGLALPVRYDIIAIDIHADGSQKIEHAQRAFYATAHNKRGRSAGCSTRHRMPKL